MNVTEVQKTIYDWVSTETGIDTIWERANAPRPIRPYMGLLVLSLNPEGMAYIGPPDELGFATIVGQSIMSLSINSFIDMNASQLNAINILDELRLSLWRETVKSLFRGKGIGYLASVGNQNFEQIVGTGYEQRGVLDINFLISSSITDDVGVIETVDGTGQFYDVTGQLKHEVDF